jgi:hypothetical protein
MEMFNKIKYVLFALMAISLVIDCFMPRAHVYYWWDNIPGFYALFALASTILLLIVSNKIADIFLRRKEDYYD